MVTQNKGTIYRTTHICRLLKNWANTVVSTQYSFLVCLS